MAVGTLFMLTGTILSLKYQTLKAIKPFRTCLKRIVPLMPKYCSASVLRCHLLGKLKGYLEVLICQLVRKALLNRERIQCKE